MPARDFSRAGSFFVPNSPKHYALRTKHFTIPDLPQMYQIQPKQRMISTHCQKL